MGLRPERRSVSCEHQGTGDGGVAPCPPRRAPGRDTPAGVGSLPAPANIFKTFAAIETDSPNRASPD